MLISVLQAFIRAHLLEGVPPPPSSCSRYQLLSKKLQSFISSGGTVRDCGVLLKGAKATEEYDLFSGEA